MNTTKYPVLRQTLIVFAFLALVGLFFVLNHFIIIPRQQQAYNNKVLRVLQEVSEDFSKRIHGKAEHLAKNRRDTTQKEKKQNPGVLQNTRADTNGTLLREIINQSFRKLDTSPDTSALYAKHFNFRTDTIFLSFADSTKPFLARPDTILIRDVLSPTIQLLHSNLFDLVMLLKREVTPSGNEKKPYLIKDSLLYKMGGLAASYNLLADTLFNNPGFGQFSSIGEMTIAGASYKAFGLPFRFANQELILVGLLDEKSYKVTTTSYSRPTLLLIVLSLVLFVLSLPLIKIYLSSRQERITTNDLRGLMVVFTAMPLLVILIAGALLLYRQTDQKTDSNLVALNTSMKESFRNEIDSALLQLRQYDRLLRSDSALNSKYANVRRSSYKSLDTVLKDSVFYPSVYRNMDDVFWVNRDGRQIAKWYSSKNEKVSYFDLSSRDYFQKMRDGKGFVRGGDTFYLEPTISWSTGEYSVNVLTTSTQDFSTAQQTNGSTKAIMTGIGTNLYSVCDPVMPKGYHFGIINESGAILFHSQTERSLHENLFAESNENFELRNAIRRKDSTLLPDIHLFDRSVKLLVTPMQGMPSLYAVTYFAKREQNLFVLHISSFTLLCASLTLFSVLLLVLLYYFFGNSASAKSFYTYESAWMKPSEKKQRFYKQCLRQQAAVVLFTFFFLLLVIIFGGNGFWFILQSSILLPIFVVTNYILLRNEYNRKQTAETRRNIQQTGTTSNESNTGKASGARAFFTKETKQSLRSFSRRNTRELLIYVLTIAFILLTLNLLHNNLSGFHPAAFFSIVFLCLSVPLTAWRMGRNLKNKPEEKTGSYLSLYAWLIFLSTVGISVLPALGIYSFAINQEKQIHVKAGQFDAAKKIEARRESLTSYFQSHRQTSADRNYIRERKLSKNKGIYLLQDSLYTAPYRQDDTTDLVAHSPFYQAVTRFLFLPKDHIDFFDNNKAIYKWYSDGLPAGHDMALAYRNETDGQTPDDIVISHNREQSHLLAGLFTSYGGGLILLCIVAFFLFQYLLIKAIARKIFLLDYFKYENSSKTDQRWVNQFYNQLPLDINARAFLKIENGLLTNDVISAMEDECIKNMMEKNVSVTEDEEEIAMAKEERILHLQYLLTPAYQAIWNKLKHDERFVLYDFALDGFTNYRNVDIIYRLYQRGLIKKKYQQLELMHHSFRSYLLGKAGSKEILALERQQNTGSAWKNIRNVFFILALAVLIFVFATQQDVSNRILVIVSGLATLVPGLLKIFDRNVGGGDGKK